MLNRQLWIWKPGYRNKRFPQLGMEHHCGNCANSVTNGGKGCGVKPKVISDGNGTVTITSSCSGISRPYPKELIRTYSKGTVRLGRRKRKGQNDGHTK